MRPPTALRTNIAHPSLSQDSLQGRSQGTTTVTWARRSPPHGAMLRGNSRCRIRNPIRQENEVASCVTHVDYPKSLGGNEVSLSVWHAMPWPFVI
ncbi:hypothetical protein MPTK1_3g04000 [Marchantia polymorpha subsp. ruderalis]|uniref:Uncharacterized protein n=2 Tax=Marchantia polymorpha TaxID=3197 RepID=A0AAF6AX85_MARPO|nr:hypothetical protein MARPO_0022s0131 [Marchantia polymorpha]BBN04369.1 hypothetical protein Mp_3g04000 [Marchantia polymorpha subsp. ruderalis]|eukprot:PTQ44035.1 hypothetical protein MARPO_0022s0131 [Marchantia polymorpha]